MDDSIKEYKRFLKATTPSKKFDFEEFGAWLDWQHTLLLDDQDADDYSTMTGHQLRWGIGHVIHKRTPAKIPRVYLDFARLLNPTDHVLSFNYDLLLERALEEIGKPYRRFSGRYQMQNGLRVADLDHELEVTLMKLHGSIDWTFTKGDERDAELGLLPLAEGVQPDDNALNRVGVIPRAKLDEFYESDSTWFSWPLLLMPPSVAKPMSGSPLVELWSGAGAIPSWRGGFNIIGCSLPPGDPYVLQFMYRFGTAYIESRKDGIGVERKGKIAIVDLRNDKNKKELLKRYQFLDKAHTEYLLDGFNEKVMQHFAEVQEFMVS